MSLAAVVLAAIFITVLGVVAAKLSHGLRLPSDPTQSRKGINLIMSKPDPDFPAQPQYTQTTTRNDTWANVTLTRKDADGSISQTLKILPRGGK